MTEIPQMRGLGMCAHLPRRQRGWIVEDLLPRMRAIGVAQVRTEIHWSQVERERGVLRIPESDLGWLDACRRAGIGVHLLLCYANEVYDDPLDPEAYGRYCGFMARELHDRGVVGFELWNEPTNFELKRRLGGSWSGAGPCPWLEHFARMVAAGAAAIKAVDPGIFVTQNVGEPQFVHLARRHPWALAQVDGQAVHPYPTRFPPETIPWGGEQIAQRDGVSVADDDHRYESLFARTQDHCRELLGRELRLDVTELGYSTYNPWRRPGAMCGYTEPVQAAYLLRSLILTCASSAGMCFVYDFMDDGTDPYEQEDHFGLITHRDDGYREKPAYAAVGRLAALMAADWVHVSRSPARLDCELRPMPVNTDIWQQAVIEPHLRISGPELHVFSTPGQHLALLWRAGRAEGELQPALGSLQIPHKGGRGVEAIDLVTGAAVGRICPRGDRTLLEDLPLAANPIAVSWPR